MEQGIPEDVAAMLAKLHDITNRVIMPAKAKGAAHALECARAFMEAQCKADTPKNSGAK